MEGDEVKEAVEARPHWACGHCKDFGFYCERNRSHCGILRTGVTCSGLHFKKTSSGLHFEKDSDSLGWAYILLLTIDQSHFMPLASATQKRSLLHVP